MPYFSRGASELYYEEYGEGPPVILLHGVGGNHTSWFNQVPSFSQRYRTIVFDQRAFGKSTDAEQVGRDEFVNDLLALLDHLSIPRAFLIGQSMGGNTVAAFTTYHPDRVAGLIICDSVGRNGLGAELEEELAILTQKNAGLSQQERVLGPKTIENDKERSLLYTQIAGFNSVNVRTVRGQTPPWSYGQLSETKVPTMFVVGEDDVLCPPRFLKAAHERVKGSSFHVLKDSGHSAYFETPKAFNAVVLPQLDAWVAQGLQERAQQAAVG